MSLVTLTSVFKSFGNLQVLKGISLSVERGTVVAVIGRSGSGKSTLIRCINGLEPIQSGEIRVGDHVLTRNERKLRALRREVGIVFQSFNLFPHLTVERNITVGLTVVQKRPREEAREIAARVLEQVGLLDKRAAYPDQLSGGQQQRVAIARCLALSPKVMLFDEVTSALDPELKGEVLRVIAQLAAGGMTMILVTHEMAFAQSVADKVVFMREGRIVEEGSPEKIFNSPEASELRQFLAAELHSKGNGHA
jgi:polar amino acid transport system ATP-binding protein